MRTSNSEIYRLRISVCRSCVIGNSLRTVYLIPYAGLQHKWPTLDVVASRESQPANCFRHSRHAVSDSWHKSLWILPIRDSQKWPCHLFSQCYSVVSMTPCSASCCFTDAPDGYGKYIPFLKPCHQHPEIERKSWQSIRCDNSKS